MAKDNFLSASSAKHSWGAAEGHYLLNHVWPVTVEPSALTSLHPLSYLLYSLVSVHGYPSAPVTREAHIAFSQKTKQHQDPTAKTQFK